MFAFRSNPSAGISRRAFLRRSGGVAAGVLLAGTPFRLLAGAMPVAPVERLYAAMGTLVRFQVYHESPEAALGAIREASALIQEVHNLMSVQDPASELAAWNRSPRGLDRPFSTLTAAALDEAMRVAALTGGRLDPTVGAAVLAYEQGRVPAPQADRTAGWDAANRRFRKAEAGVALDLGGTAKGWAVDRAVEVLQRHGATAGLVNAGGDLRVFGAPPEAAAWQVGLRDPRDPDGLLAVLPLRDAAVATSGDYEADGSTLVDPRDLSRVRLAGSLSIVSASCGLADALSTALSVEPDVALLPAGAQAVIARTGADGFSLYASPGLALEAADSSF